MEGLLIENNLKLKIDAFVKNNEFSLPVIPTKVRIQLFKALLDSRFHWSDGFLTFYEFVKIEN